MPKVEPETEKIENLKLEYQEKIAEEPTKKKRGRPKGSVNKPKEEKTPVIVLPDAVVSALISLPYKAVANIRGKHWELSEDELKMMVPAHQALVSKYVPDWLQAHAELYTVLLMHGMIVFARVEIDIRIQREIEARKKGNDEPTKSVDNDTGETGFGKIYYDAKETKPSSTIRDL